MSRVPHLDAEKLAPEQRKVYDAIVAGPRGGVVGPLLVWLSESRACRPRAGIRRVLPLRARACCRGFPNSPSGDRSALAGGLRVARACAPSGLKPGSTQAPSRRFVSGKQPNLTKSDEAAVYAFAKETPRHPQGL